MGKKNIPLTMAVHQETSDALKAFLDAQPARPSKSSVVIQALHEFLARHGFWPPKKDEEKPPEKKS